MGKKSRREKNNYNNQRAIATDNLFDNPMVKAAFSAMTEEQRQDYKLWGEYLFSNVNMPDAKILKNLPVPVSENIAYIISGLKSGLSPDDLEDDEKELMVSVFGKDWKSKYE